MKLYLNSINLGTDGLGPDFDGHTKYFLTKFATDAELLLEIQRINPPGYLIPYMPVEPDVCLKFHNSPEAARAAGETAGYTVLLQPPPPPIDRY